MKNFGVCGSKGCRRSFENVERIDRFINDLMVPEESGGGLPRPIMLDPELRAVFQEVTPDSLYCRCGGKLLGEAELPRLGLCSKCRRAYDKADLGSACCPKCGERVAISEAAEEEYRRQEAVNRILTRVPVFQRRGWLPF
jgi:hypothetical protein